MKAKWFALLTVFGVLFAAFSAVAAPPGGQETPPPYTLTVEGGTLRLTRAGKTATYAVTEPAEVTIRSDKDGDLLVVLRTPAGYRTVSLGNQSVLDVFGSIDTLNLSALLRKTVSVRIAPEASIQKLQVRCDGQVTVEGKIQEATLTGRAALTLQPTSEVGTLTVYNTQAAVSTTAGASVGTAYATSGASVAGVNVAGPPPVREPSAWEPSSGTADTEKGGGADKDAAGGQTAAPDSYGDVEILAVYPKRGEVRVDLSRAVPLGAEAFYISCPSGKDMTILSVSSLGGADDNRVYRLSTAYYADNTYQMEITLPNGRLIRKTFTTNGAVPQITNAQAARTGEGELSLTFNADDFGTVYYMAVPASRAAIGPAAPATAEALKRQGEAARVMQGLNTYSITGLTPSTPYTLYYAVADEDSGGPLMQPSLPVPADPPTGPPTSAITLTAENVADDHFRVTLSQATGEPLGVGAFKVTCPAGSITLGRVETTDNRVYEVYLAPGNHLYSNNTITVTVTFPDGSTANGAFYADNFGPVFSSSVAQWIDDSTVVLRLKSDEAGTLYYITADDAASKPTPQELRESGNSAPLAAGTSETTLAGVPAGHTMVYYVGMDRGQNLSSFTNYVKIDPKSDTPGTPADNEIAGITVLVNETSPVAHSRIKMTLQNAVDIGEVTVDTLSILSLGGGTSTAAPRVISVDPGASGSGPFSEFILGFTGVLPAGTYRLEWASPTGINLRKEFTITG